MNSDLLLPPELPMPPGRAQARRLALSRELAASGAATTTTSTTATAATRRRPARWKIAVPVLAAGAAAGVFAISGLTAHRTSPTASWTAVPTPLGGAEAAASQQQCQSRLSSQHWPIAVSAMSGVLAERRGALTAVLLSGAGQYGMCVGDPADPVFIGVGQASRFDAAAGLVLDGDPGKLNGSGPFRVAYGQVAASVTSVVIDTGDGRQVDATVAAGRFFAWWPSGADPKTITAFAADGSVVKVLTPAPSPGSPSPVREPGAR